MAFHTSGSDWASRSGASISVPGRKGGDFTSPPLDMGMQPPAREACAHAFVGVRADRNRAALGFQAFQKSILIRTDNGNNGLALGLQMPRGLPRDRDAGGKRGAQLVGAEPLRGSRREKQPDDCLQEVFTSGVFTSQAEGSKRLGPRPGTPQPLAYSSRGSMTMPP